MMTPREAKKLRTTLNFNIQHEETGGVRKLMELADAHRSIYSMADHFNTSPQRISLVLKVLLGQTYEQYLIKHGVQRQGITSSD